MVVVVGRAVRSAAGIDSDELAVITTFWAMKAWLLLMFVQSSEAGGVQPLRQISV
jgi:hypothetical protein